MTMTTRGELEQRGVLLTVAYDGTDFHGWAQQRDARTVEEVLHAAVLALDPTASTLRGTSRTDSGVHAEAQLVAFDCTRDIPARGWVLGTNQHLPDDVAVRAARSVPPLYNPRHASKMKRYRYRVLTDTVRDPLLRVRAWRVGPRLDLERVREEARAIVGTHDFTAFRASGDERVNTVRTIEKVDVDVDRDERQVSFAFTGTAFLYNMVRILTGTLVDVGTGRRPLGTIAAALSAKDRSLAGITAPAHGLTLEAIDLKLPDTAGEAWPR
jgi:tRNA pseudouridine38-40 synthase